MTHGLGRYTQAAASGMIHPERTPLTPDERARRAMIRKAVYGSTPSGPPLDPRAPAVKLRIFDAENAWIMVADEPNPIRCWNVPAVRTLAAKIARRLGMRLVIDESMGKVARA